MDPATIPEVTRLVSAFDATVAPHLTGLRRRQMYTYYDLFVQLHDFIGEDAVEAARAAATHPLVEKLNADLAPFLTRYDPALADTTATSFYHWEGAPIDKAEGLHSTVIVNRVADPVIPEVARLFGELDATSFPFDMGTRRRQLFSFHGVYFHIQDFERANGGELISKAWRDADPRFVQICEDLDPLVHKYDPQRWRSTADQIGTRFYHWEAPA
jgi:hypothetical protein